MNKTRRLYQLTPEEAKVVNEMRAVEQAKQPPHPLADQFPVGAAILVTRCFGGGSIREWRGTVIGYTPTGIRVKFPNDPYACAEYHEHQHVESYSHKQLNTKTDVWTRLRLI